MRKSAANNYYLELYGMAWIVYEHADIARLAGPRLLTGPWPRANVRRTANPGNTPMAAPFTWVIHLLGSTPGGRFLAVLTRTRHISLNSSRQLGPSTPPA
jgi:hypothetical protein